MGFYDAGTVATTVDAASRRKSTAQKSRSSNTRRLGDSDAVDVASNACVESEEEKANLEPEGFSFFSSVAVAMKVMKAPWLQASC